MSRIIQPFTIMCKPVCGVCNLDCAYCYYTMKPRELYPDVHTFHMTDQVLETYTRQYVETMPLRCEFGWQGGEPLLAGKGFFRRAVDLQRQYARPGQVITNALQTNGTLLDEEWCELLRDSGFLVGISLDGPPQWHDAYRRDRAGECTWHRAWAGLELLIRRRVEFNVLVTLNSVNAPHAGDIYRYFVNRGVRYLQFIPVLERDEHGRIREFSCTSRQFGQFMLDVFEQWATRDAGKVSERFIDDVLHTIVFGKASMCCYSDRCANAHVLEFNGDLYACDHFVFPEWRIGNIMDRPLADLVTDPKLDEFAAMKLQLPLACRDCEFLAFCRAGCPKHHVPIGTDAARVNWFCQGHKDFFAAALPELRRMAEHVKRDELPPLKAPAAPAADAAAPSAAFQAGPPPDAPRPMKLAAATPAAEPRAAAGPGLAGKTGRNDPCPCGSGRKFKRCCGRA